MGVGSGSQVERRGLKAAAMMAWVWAAVACVVSVCVAVSVGEGAGLVTGLITVVDTVAVSGWMVGMYVLGAWGFGRLIWRTKQSHAYGSWVEEIGVGLALMLYITHLLGMIGWLDTLIPMLLSSVGVLIAFLGPSRDRDPAGSGDDQPRHGLVRTVGMVVFGAAAGLMIAAACNPAGVLWDSEYGNYDSLSYHLELPRVWMESGRVWPVEFNVYSFLPSYVEAAYVHMAMLGGTGDGGLGLADDGGKGIYAAQLLSVVFTVLGACASGSVARRVCRVIGVDGFADVAGWVAGALVLTTPWMVVVGTISYNESAVVLLTMCGVGIALETGWSMMRRAVGTALVMGVACSCKPTALFLACPVVGVVLLAMVPIKAWWRVCLVGGVVGVVVLLPWLVRNELAAGNPVFPMMSGVFGEGHWDAGQHAKYASAHSFDGGFIERVKMLVMADADGATHVSRFRGLTNLQWGVTAGMGMLGLISLVLVRKTRKAGVVCVVGVGLVLVAWMGLTHLQSRFLVPMAGVFGLLGGVGVGIAAERISKQLALSFGGLAVVVSGLMSAGLFAGQSGGNPNGLLVAGAGAFTGEIEGFEDVLWWGGVNRVAGDDRAVYLVGDATPVYLQSPVVYNTTYDGWLIGELMREWPADPDAWNGALIERDIGWVVINLSEVDRLGRSGWGDPDVTVESMVAWAGTLGEPAMVWDGGRRVMFRISSSNGQSADEGD